MDDLFVLSGLKENIELMGDIKSFSSKRGSGAEKIAESAKEKGGVALLTYHHFKVKMPYYIKVAKNGLNYDAMKKEYNELCSELHSHMKNIESMDQIKFQELVGKIEVIGELLIKNKQKKSL